MHPSPSVVSDHSPSTYFKTAALWFLSSIFLVSEAIALDQATKTKIIQSGEMSSSKVPQASPIAKRQKEK